MKLAIIGSRAFNNLDRFHETLLPLKEKIELIVSGGAKGADSIAENYAKENKIPVIIHYPDWKQYGKKAGIIRNKLIIVDSDAVIAFWDGESKGTKNSIDIAKRQTK